MQPYAAKKTLLDNVFKPFSAALSCTVASGSEKSVSAGAGARRGGGDVAGKGQLTITPAAPSLLSLPLTDMAGFLYFPVASITAE